MKEYNKKKEDLKEQEQDTIFRSYQSSHSRNNRELSAKKDKDIKSYKTTYENDKKTLVVNSKYIEMHFLLKHVKVLLLELYNKNVSKKEDKQYLETLLNNINDLNTCLELIMSVLESQLNTDHKIDINSIKESKNKGLLLQQKNTISGKFKNYDEYLKNIIIFSDGLLKLLENIFKKDVSINNIDSRVLKNKLRKLGFKESDIQIDSDFLTISKELKRNLKELLESLPCGYDDVNIDQHILNWLKTNTDSTLSSDVTSDLIRMSLGKSKDNPIVEQSTSDIYDIQGQSIDTEV